MKNTIRGNNKNTVRSLVYNLLNKHTVELVEQYFDPSLEIYCNDSQFKGRSGFRRMLAFINYKYPHRHYELKNLLEEGNTIIAHWMVVIKVAQLHEPISFDGVFVIQFEKHCIIRISVIWNELYFFQALDTAKGELTGHRRYRRHLLRSR